MAVRDTFNAIAPALATDVNADAFLGFAVDQLNPVVFGRQYELAVAYLAAHMLTIARRSEEGGPAGGGSGPVTSERAGEVSRQYGQMSVTGKGDLAYYNTTPFGMEFLRIRRLRVGTRMFAASDDFFSNLGRSDDG